MEGKKGQRRALSSAAAIHERNSVSPVLVDNHRDICPSQTAIPLPCSAPDSGLYEREREERDPAVLRQVLCAAERDGSRPAPGTLLVCFSWQARFVCFRNRYNQDRSRLAQIKRVREMLKRGVGVHHAGLLPIVKEVVELLFCKGLVRVLLATGA